MKRNIPKQGMRSISLLLTLVFLLLALPIFPAQAQEGLDYSLIENNLNTWQYYFCRTVMSLALKDQYDTGVFASITAGQAFYEGGCCGSPISIIAQNHFGIRAYPTTWTGKIYDDKTHVLYNSYNDAVNLLGASVASKTIFWRAYDTWDEGIKGHSDLLHEEAKYVPVLNAADYREAALQLRLTGYCGSAGYDTNLIKYIEKYGFQQLDSVQADELGVYGLIMNHARVEIKTGDKLALRASAYPDPGVSLPITWKSDRPGVATVDQNGNVTALKQGYTLITATYNGKEACCVVCVDANGYVMNQNLSVYSKPDASSTVLGKLSRGQPVHVNSKQLYTTADGTQYYAISASVGSGTLVSGYAPAKHIYPGSETLLSIGTPETILHLEKGDTQTIPVEVYAEELKNKPMVWASGNPDAVAVDQKGKITAKADGVSVVTVSINDTVALSVTVYVGDAAYEVLTANAAVNLRLGPTQGSRVLGVIRKGDQVKLLGEPDTGWYHVLAVIGGVPMVGYSYARYFNREGEPIDPVDPPGTGNPGVTVPYQTGTVQVDDSLNVRDQAGMSGKKIASLKPNESVYILETDIYLPEEPVYRDWYRISFTHNGKQMEGYVCSAYIRLVGTVDIPVSNPTVQPYVVEDEYVANIPAGCTYETFCAQFSQSVRITRNGVELQATERVRTGDTVEFLSGSNVVSTHIAAVRGDTNGDGKISAPDYLMIKRACLRTLTLEGAALRAARVTGNDKVVSSDYLLIKRTVLGTLQLT